MWHASWGLSHWETHDTTSKSTFDAIKEAFHAKKWNFVHKEGTSLPPPQGFSQIRM